mmetsp:Transcript_97696/g.301195  ORF Transcript_97696/g.301195 Transcript_97696/m.301195 type:complete len:271 (+) Transcript_97696:1285-2097(+)
MGATRRSPGLAAGLRGGWRRGIRGGSRCRLASRGSPPSRAARESARSSRRCCSAAETRSGAAASRSLSSAIASAGSSERRDRGAMHPKTCTWPPGLSAGTSACRFTPCSRSSAAMRWPPLPMKRARDSRGSQPHENAEPSPKSSSTSSQTCSLEAVEPLPVTTVKPGGSRPRRSLHFRRACSSAMRGPCARASRGCAATGTAKVEMPGLKLSWTSLLAASSTLEVSSGVPGAKANAKAISGRPWSRQASHALWSHLRTTAARPPFAPRSS